MERTIKGFGWRKKDLAALFQLIKHLGRFLQLMWIDRQVQIIAGNNWLSHFIRKGKRRAKNLQLTMQDVITDIFFHTIWDVVVVSKNILLFPEKTLS